jgi:hypothetical protein
MYPFHNEATETMTDEKNRPIHSILYFFQLAASPLRDLTILGPLSNSYPAFSIQTIQ